MLNQLCKILIIYTESDAQESIDESLEENETSDSSGEDTDTAYEV